MIVRECEAVTEGRISDKRRGGDEGKMEVIVYECNEREEKGHKMRGGVT